MKMPVTDGTRMSKQRPRLLLEIANKDLKAPPVDILVQERPGFTGAVRVGGPWEALA